MTQNNDSNLETILTDAGTAVMSVAKPNFSMVGAGGITTSAAGSTITVDGASMGSGNLLSFQIFTADATWNKPLGVNSIMVEIVGGGGGGGGARRQFVGQMSNSSGGSGGGYSRRFISSPGANESVVIGLGGVGGIGLNPGSNGTTSSFGAWVTGGGGFGGNTNVGQTSATGVNGGLGTNGDFNSRGGFGGGGRAAPTTQATGGNGGNSKFGAGGRGNIIDSNGENGLGFGSGGSGCRDISNVNRTGGSGTSGICIVWEFS